MLNCTAKSFGLLLIGVWISLASWLLTPLQLKAQETAADSPRDSVQIIDQDQSQPLPGSALLTMDGDIASQMVSSIDQFLLSELDAAASHRSKFWARDFTGPESYLKSVEPNRSRLAKILGVRDERTALSGLTLRATTEHSAILAETARWRALEVNWPVIGEMHGAGILLEPIKDAVQATTKGNVVVIPDADQLPEDLCGLNDTLPPTLQTARRLADAGYRVVVPVLINRNELPRAPPGRAGRSILSNREFLYRPSFELGRHLIGYEIQKVLSCIDWFDKIPPLDANAEITVIGHGEGGLVAFYAGALDRRIDTTMVSGYFGPRLQIWQEPIERNLFGLLREFGDAEVASLIWPRTLVVDFTDGPETTVSGRGAAPGKLSTPPIEERLAELAKAADLVNADNRLPPRAQRGVLSKQSLVSVREWNTQHTGSIVVPIYSDDAIPELPIKAKRTVDATHRQQQQVAEIVALNQRLLNESATQRDEFFAQLDTTSIESFHKSIETYRTIFREEVIGNFNHQLINANPRTRKRWETSTWTGYEVVLDVFGGVFAYGVLLVPKDLDPGETRPVVVCQHGLEGRPTDVFLNDHRAYHNFAARLADRGFITFAPQNLYLFQDRFRTLQRKANPLGKTLFSIIVPQHQQIVNWLQDLPFVDAQRIAFYGLSYGGKSAMRIPALVPEYCLSICSADFNEWVRKNASTQDSFSYVWTGEYEIFEFDLANTFNYAEMAALICPRPFMVERGHFDGVGTDEWVAFEFAKVRRLYQAELGLSDRAEIEWFPGPHTINGQGTFRFLHHHLDWPASSKPDMR